MSELDLPSPLAYPHPFKDEEIGPEREGDLPSVASLVFCWGSLGSHNSLLRQQAATGIYLARRNLVGSSVEWRELQPGA